MKFRLNQDIRIGSTVISEGSIVEVIEEKDRVASVKTADDELLQTQEEIIESFKRLDFSWVLDKVHSEFSLNAENAGIDTDSDVYFGIIDEIYNSSEIAKAVSNLENVIEKFLDSL